MKDIHLQQGHLVEQLLHIGFAEEMSRFIEHQTSPGVARPVLDLDEGDKQLQAFDRLG